MIYDIAKIMTMQTGDSDHLTDDIYLAGCTYECPYCFNKELWNKSYNFMDINHIMSYLSDIEWVALMGGEPTQQPIEELIKTLRWCGKKVLLFSGNPEAINYDADYIHIDMKKGMVYRSNLKGNFGIVTWDGWSYDILKQMTQELNKNEEIIIKHNVYETKRNAEDLKRWLVQLGFKNVYMAKRLSL